MTGGLEGSQDPPGSPLGYAHGVASVMCVHTLNLNFNLSYIGRRKAMWSKTMDLVSIRRSGNVLYACQKCAELRIVH